MGKRKMEPTAPAATDGGAQKTQKNPMWSYPREKNNARGWVILFTASVAAVMFGLVALVFIIMFM